MKLFLAHSFLSLTFTHQPNTAHNASMAQQTRSLPCTCTTKINNPANQRRAAPDALAQVKKAFKGIFKRSKKNKQQQQQQQQQPAATATTTEAPEATPIEANPPAPAPGQAPAPAPATTTETPTEAQPAALAQGEPKPEEAAALTEVKQAIERELDSLCDVDVVVGGRGASTGG